MSPFQPANPDWDGYCRAHFERQEINRTFAISMPVLEPGYCELEMPFDRRFTQQDGVLQAGVPGVLGDNAGGYAGLSLFPAGSNILAVEFKINLLSPGLGERFRACAQVVKTGRTLTVNDIEVFAFQGDSKKLIAKMQQTAFRIDQPIG